MKKVSSYVVLFVVSLFVAVSFYVLPTSAESSDDQTKIEQLKTTCFDQYKEEYDDRISRISVTNSDYYEGIKESELATEAEEAKASYQKLAQINIDLLNCYKDNAGSDTTLISKIDNLLEKANAELSAVTSFDYKKLLGADSKVSDTITIPVKTKKYFRLRTYCMDSKRGAPEAGEEFYFAGDVDDLRQNLCQLLQEGKDEYQKNIQDKVWASEIASIQNQEKTENKEKFFETQLGLYLIFGLSIISLFLAIVFIIFAKKSLSTARKIFGYAVFFICLLGAIGFALWGTNNIINKKPCCESILPSNPNLDKKSEYFSTLVKEGKLAIRAVSAGRMKEIDLTVENLSDGDITMDAGCLLFVPKTSKVNFQLSDTLNPFIDKVWAAIDGSTSQKLGSVGSVGDSPPIPSAPSAVGDLFGELQQIASTRVQAALLDFKDNPNDETLKNLLDAIALCQQTGCGAEDSAMKEVIDTWQKVLDQTISEYEANKSAENKEKLERATEICQYVGCNDNRAKEALGI